MEYVRCLPLGSFRFFVRLVLVRDSAWVFEVEKCEDGRTSSYASIPVRSYGAAISLANMLEETSDFLRRLEFCE